MKSMCDRQGVMGMNRGVWVLAASAVLSASAGAHAQLSQRYHTTLNGNFTVIGNTLAQDVAPGVPAPVVGSIGAVGVNTADAGADVFWRSNAPAIGQAQANVSIGSGDARSQALLVLPPGSLVRYARLYWAATGTGPAADMEVQLSRPGGFSQTIAADASMTMAGNRYQATADVTTIVQTNGFGAYQVGGVDCFPLADLQSDSTFAAWTLVVVYEFPPDPLRDIRIADGLHLVSPTSPLAHTFTLGSWVPSSGINGSLAVVCYGGDDAITGESLTVSSIAMSNALNPASNFANGTRSYFGAATSNTGDLPQLTGTPRSMSGFDLDVFDLSPVLTSLQTEVNMTCATTADEYIVGIAAASVAVICRPFEFLHQPATQTVCLGSDVQLTVAIDTMDAIGYRWQKNGADLEDGPRIQGAFTGTLTIMGVQAGDAADYRCLVTSLCNSAYSNPATLTLGVCCPADFDGDGALGVSDIFAFLAAWFSGCP
ncbi:MAG: immunoglobulin domain-containing protein [Phycisphaeraceae bacterium]|nr:immunoglobulin domain-containing protein [Phycisphaeraceae bacterium]MBX3407874.1 immunoglobulin domain-containing protein [Phycisphaeraceae bacterium]